ncbi:hypothetical protein LEMA_P098660.1 [Plenodomus lingam JN3]|uniref:Ribonuclease T2-like n=1 Tax=Leptosphaeria maculans (strain JN3 / isolate v23.1.3 / race Av1-4-5-6-7-8) TaxID=985895 RepID=E5A4B2_LEPMJ|nr:hypothetical protein LEMA_P098660.1 [Plenodomus lingam JN3]CBX98457.1 hypothetical protein LEMA_P098660.1 [Plenodomus lingam JN3]
MPGSIAQAAREGVHNAAIPSLVLDKAKQGDSMIPSIRTFGKLAMGGAQMLLGSGSKAAGDFTQNCPMPQLSCHNTTVVDNLCCFNAPGGQLLQTQFWDTAPATGPDDSWTLHGLWPDRCDGTYEANCDPTRIYKNITSILSTSAASPTLLSYMSTYWKDYKGDDESFWQHEWSKHGTCISTLEPHCYPNHTPTEEVVDYFQTAVDLFHALPSYTWLADAGITPSTTQTYTFSQIQAAIQQHRPGVAVTLGCKAHALNEIWYHFDVRGPLQSGEFVPADPDGTKSSCPATGIRYLPKRPGSGAEPPSTTTTGAPLPTSTAEPEPRTPFSGRGFLTVVLDGEEKGCIITKGTWFTSGSCATFTATPVSSSSSSPPSNPSDTDTASGPFTLSSSKGPCAILAGALSCSHSVSAATGFTRDNDLLVVGGSSRWSAERVPRGTAQSVVRAGGEGQVRVGISWKAV